MRFSKKILLFVGVIAFVFLLHKPLRKAGHAVLLRTALGPVLVGWLSHFGFYRKKAQPRLLRKEMVWMLYQTVKDVHDVMEAANIPYWIDFGTLLGAVRHKGFIPWDDDIDLSMRKTDKPLFVQRCIPILERLGYHVKTGEGFDGVCVSPKDFTLLPHEKMPGCDIFFSEKISDGFQNQGIGVWISEQDLLPLTLYPFGPLQLWGPHHPIPSLDKEYGKNWKNVAEMGYDHHMLPQAQGAKKIPFLLKEYQPALPIKPLIDHRPDLLSL